MLEFGNVLKAQMTQSVLTVVLERWGYRVARLGVEELFGEIKYLDKTQYLALGLPKQLRTLPDLLVATSEVTKAYLVEVKFRKRYDEEVAQELTREIREQREYWHEAYVVIMIAEPFAGGGRFHQDFIRVLRPDRSDLLRPDLLRPGGTTMEDHWTSLATLDGVFKPLNSPGGLYKVADYVTPVLKLLAKL